MQDHQFMSAEIFQLWVARRVYSGLGLAIFLAKMPNGISAFCRDLRRLSLVRHIVSGSYNSNTVYPKITKFYTDIQTDVIYSAQDTTSLAASGRK